MNSFSKHSFLLILLLCIPLTSGCGGKEVPPDLKQAATIIERFASPMMLSNSMFAAAFPECKPSQFVRYMFSDLAAAEMPIGERMAGEMDREESRAIGIPLWPDSVSMTANAPDIANGKQIVLKHDDSRNVIIVELYQDPAMEPVDSFEITIPVVTPSEIAKISFQSNVEMGARY